ncbi:MAG TPA: adenylate/guanylate cyclase domain-containing protein [Anaerolineae bacterium]|nr:adenylate/guanylate cyclase domain-containing protein [Anaerolineae bacterium]
MNELASYLPIDRRQALVRDENLPEEAVGTVLFADISGFTPLTTALVAELGPKRGTEELPRQLNRIYTALIREVHRFHGSVIGFSGDAITCWLVDDDGHRGVSCALAMQEVMKRFAAVRTPTGTVITLAIKVAVVTGPVRRFVVGLETDQLVDVLAGSTLDRMAAAEHLAQSGEVIVGPEVATKLGDILEVVAWHEPVAGQKFAVVAGLKEVAQEWPWPMLSAEELPNEEWKPWLLPAVYDRLAYGQGQFLTELRTAVALFIRFRGLDYDEDPDVGQKLNRYVRWVQTILRRYEGALIQVTTGDKGSYLYATFGAPIAHEDNARRGVAAALALQKPPADMDFIIDIQIGLSQGQMRTGAYGSRDRRTYGVLGDETNMAARLMTAAKGGQILVSTHVAEAAAHDYAFEELPAVKVKGRATPMRIFTIQSELSERVTSSLEESLSHPLVGRLAERGVLTRTLRGMHRRGESGQILIEGEAGIGKSRLVETIFQQARALQIRTVVGVAQATEQTTPYFAWRDIFEQLFNFEVLPSVGAERDLVQEHVEEQVMATLPEWAPYLPLLNVVLPLELGDTEATAVLNEAERGQKTEEFLVALLASPPEPFRKPKVQGRRGRPEALAALLGDGQATRHTSRKRRSTTMLLIVEDGQWLDSASWHLLERVQGNVEPLLIVLATRPFADKAPSSYLALEGAPRSTLLKLDPLSPDDAIVLVQERLQVNSLPQVVADLIRDRAEGHPFFSEELAYSLRDAGLLKIENGECELTAKARNWHQLTFPDSLQGVITSRIDRLRPQQQLTLKVASIIGRTFEFDLLYMVHPTRRATNRDAVTTDLAQLERLEFVLRPEAASGEMYAFKNMMIEQAAYNLMTFAQRQQLHRQVAEWYEKNYAADLAPYYPLLAHHWREAVVGHYDNSHMVYKAIFYLRRAGDTAAHIYANVEAIAYYNQALELTHHLPAEMRQDNNIQAEIKSLYLVLGAVLVSSERGGEALDIYRELVSMAREDENDDWLLAGLQGQIQVYGVVGGSLAKDDLLMIAEEGRLLAEKLDRPKVEQQIQHYVALAQDR